MYQDTSHAQEFFRGNPHWDPPCEEVFRLLGSAGGACHFPMLTFSRAGPQPLALCLRLFSVGSGICCVILRCHLAMHLAMRFEASRCKRA